jgi:hypothetical protein
MLPPATFSSYVSLSSPSTGLVAAAEGCSVIVLTPIKGSGHHGPLWNPTLLPMTLQLCVGRHTLDDYPPF